MPSTIIPISITPTTHKPIAQHGFSLVEVMIVVAIIGVLAAIVYPNYQQYIVKTKRTDMMSEMQNIATQIESRKLAQGSYSNAIVAGLGGDYPKQGMVLYTISVTDPLIREWTITAEPKSDTQMSSDGTLTLNYQALKCRGSGADKKCGTGNEWKD